MNNTLSRQGINHIIKKLIDYKNQIIENCEEMIRRQKENEKLTEAILIDWRSSPLQIGKCGYITDDWRVELKKRLWKRLVRIIHLERYMLCSEFKKLQDQIQNNRVPDFEFETVVSWVQGLKSLIYENLEKLTKEVFQRITKGTYKTSKSYKAPKKKRNNNGIDKYFILSSGDRGYWQSAFYNPTITDDLEKVVYLLAGQPLPEKTLREKMYQEKINEIELPWIKVTCYQNGNTHYKFLDESIREKLNKIGAGKSNFIGENVKIKILEDL